MRWTLFMGGAMVLNLVIAIAINPCDDCPAEDWTAALRTTCLVGFIVFGIITFIMVQWWRDEMTHDVVYRVPISIAITVVRVWTRTRWQSISLHCHADIIGGTRPKVEHGIVIAQPLPISMGVMSCQPIQIPYALSIMFTELGAKIWPIPYGPEDVDCCEMMDARSMAGSNRLALLLVYPNQEDTEILLGAIAASGLDCEATII